MSQLAVYTTVMAELQNPDKIEWAVLHRSPTGARHLVEDRHKLLDRDVITASDIEQRLLTLQPKVTEPPSKELRDDILLLRELAAVLTDSVLSTPEDSDWIRTWEEAVAVLISNISRCGKRLLRIPVVDSRTVKRKDVVNINNELWLVE